MANITSSNLVSLGVRLPSSLPLERMCVLYDPLTFETYCVSINGEIVWCPEDLANATYLAQNLFEELVKFSNAEVAVHHWADTNNTLFVAGKDPSPYSQKGSL
jgi:hypothetical protein